MLHLLQSVTGFLAGQGAESLVYKPVPHIYHRLPSEEDLYALFRLNATLSVRNVSSVIFSEDRLKFRDIRKSGIRKAIRQNITISESTDFKTFWQILTSNLHDRYNAAPVHSVEEIEHLATLFPDNIRLFGAFDGERMIAGAVIYVTTHVAHCQYISASPDGKGCGALDLLFDRLINSEFPSRDISTSAHPTRRGTGAQRIPDISERGIRSTRHLLRHLHSAVQNIMTIQITVSCDTTHF